MPRRSSRRPSARDVREVGLLGALVDAGPAASSLFQRGGLAVIGTSLDDHHWSGRAPSGDGLGTRGHGPSAGGDGPLDIGRLGPARGLGPFPSGAGDGVTLGAPRTLRPSLSPEPALILEADNLDRGEVARVVRRNISRFRFCYERALGAEPGLEGKVGVRFTIAPEGRVALAELAESTLGSPAVEACVLGVMRSLEFPRPRGGGVAVVLYPFVFTAR
jgi:TonB family protein